VVDANGVDAEVVAGVVVVVQVSVHSLQDGALGQAVLVADFEQLGAGVLGAGAVDLQVTAK
jgi:hypothetical protein